MNLRDFKRPDPKIVEPYRKVAKCYSGSCVFADVPKRGGVIGVAVIPSANLKDMLDAARAQPEREEATRKRIAQSRTFEQLLEEFGRI
jgi:hypothetical protein